MKKKIHRFIKEFHQNVMKRAVSDKKIKEKNYFFKLRQFDGPTIHKEYLTNKIRIAHLSDQHVGKVSPLKMQIQAIELALAQDPHVVVISGDFVCHNELYLADLTEMMKKIDKPLFVTLGNHDHWTNGKAVKKALIKGGAEVLENCHTNIKIGSDTLQIVGLDDAYTHNDDIAQATKRTKKNCATIGISHIPETADALWAKGVPLIFSGHTHAGQITVAGLHELILGKIVGHKYIHGLYGDLDKPAPLGAVYVSAGIGSAVMPLRIGEKSKREIAIFDLGPN